MDVSKVAAATLVLANAIYLAVLGIGDYTLTTVQNGAILLVVNTTVAVGLALYAHFKAGTAKEPVAIGATSLAWTEAILGLVTAFAWWDFSATKASLVQGVVIAVVALIGLFYVRAKVTPEGGG